MDLQQKPSPMYWQSLEELHGDPDVLAAKHDEFKKGVTEDFEISQLSGLSRRRFLAAMGASAAFALASCKNYLDKGEVIPYNAKPEELTVGRPNYYASTVTTHSGAHSALIKTREGRPIFITGNPDHPISQGRISAHPQAKIMGLYDPERLLGPQGKAGAQSSWADADKTIGDALRGLKDKGQKAVVLSHAQYSPTAKRVLDEFSKAYGADLLSYTLFDDSNRARAWKAAYGSDAIAGIAWDEADVIVALESDFLGAEGDEEVERLFSTRRDVLSDKPFNRLYAVEGNLSATGMNADYRLRLRPDAQLAFALALANALAGAGLSLPGELRALSGSSDLKALAQTYGMAASTIDHLVSDLAKSRGKALVYAGSRLPEAVHAVVNGINEALGATALYRPEHARPAQLPVATADQLKALVADMKAGKVGVVIHLDSNPVYHLAALGYGDALSKVPVSVLLSTHGNETGAASSHVLPIHHDLESWGDYQLRPGLLSLQQPVVAPLHDSRQAEGLLLAWTQGVAYSEKLYLDYLKRAWQSVHTAAKPLADFNTFWTNALHDGFVATGAAAAPKLAAYKGAGLSGVSPVTPGADYVVSLCPGYATGDGEFANNGWLQEIPHPVSKVVWDNYAAMSVNTAKELGVKTDGQVRISVGNAEVVLPVLEQPGMADKVIS
ncbi:MAG: molybdopterin oxidoreductase, partial [Candidatus Melainabacteria bacterium HGW-Melainabacteria-1]